MAVGAQLVNDSNKDVPIIIRDGSFRLICFDRDLISAYQAHNPIV
jgi:hypothetical protein